MKAGCGKSARPVWAADGGQLAGDCGRLLRPDTFEAAEGNEAVEGRGRLEGMPSERGRSPDAEPGHSKKFPASLGGGVFTFVNLREEPGAGKPHAGICGGEAEWPSYPTRSARGTTPNTLVPCAGGLFAYSSYSSGVLSGCLR